MIRCPRCNRPRAWMCRSTAGRPCEVGRLKIIVPRKRRRRATPQRSPQQMLAWHEMNRDQRVHGERIRAYWHQKYEQFKRDRGAA